MRTSLSILAVFCLLAGSFLAGCTGDTGPTGPAGDKGEDGSPRPIKILLAASTTEVNMKEMMVIALRDGLFPIGTEMSLWTLGTSTPTLEYLRQFDCVLCWSSGTFQDATTLGNNLADYIDEGGGVVLAQFAFSPRAPVQGRILSDGYSPLRPGPISNILGNRQIDFLSLSFPLHPIFQNTDLFNLKYPAQPDFSSPVVDPSATVIALDDYGEPAVAVNSRENVIGLNMIGGWYYGDPEFASAWPLITNSCLFVAKAF